MVEEKLIELPEGYTVEYDSAVGYCYKDSRGRILVQHPKDNNSIRKLVLKLADSLEKSKL